IQRFGGSTIEIRVEARKFNVYTHEEKVVCSTSMIFVRLDEDGKAIPIAQHVKDRYPDLVG
ncbi:MAG: acyl-CoA thioesterase, partial [Flavobacteriales bacterium]